MKFRSFKYYILDGYEKSLDETNFPNYENFDNLNDAYLNFLNFIQ